MLAVLALVLAAVVVLLLVAMFVGPPLSRRRFYGDETEELRRGAPECIYGDEVEELRRIIPGLTGTQLAACAAEAAEWEADNCLRLIARSVAAKPLSRRIGREAIRAIRTGERRGAHEISAAIGRIEAAWRDAGGARSRPLAIRFAPEFAAAPSTHTPLTLKKRRW